MSVQKRGHEAAASRYSQAKREVERLEHDRATLTERVQADQRRLIVLEQEIPRAKLELAQQQHIVGAEQSQLKLEHLLAVAAELDSSGENPERLAKWTKLIGELRFLKRIGVSHEAASLVMRRMRGLEPGYKPTHKSWLAQAESWVHPQSTSAAA